MKTIKELEEEMRFPSIETEAVLTQTRDVLKLIDELASWTCECNCVTFDGKVCRSCGKPPKYGEIDYDELKARIEGKDTVLVDKQADSNKRCDKCGEKSNILHGDYGELLCPKCYEELNNDASLAKKEGDEDG